VIEAKDYDAWGVAMTGRSYLSGVGAKEGYTGKERDAETGLDYFGARYYLGAIGRWGAVDALSDQYPSWSPYTYVLNSPLRLVDPDGTAACDITLCGENGSSVTIETELIDVEVDVTRLGIDFGGNHTVSGEAVVLAALDVVGIVDPTGVADGLAAALYAQRGEVGNLLISAAGLLPVAGDLAKGGRIAKQVETITDAIDNPIAKTLGSPAKSLTEQAADLVSLNGGRNRVTLRSPNQQIEVDLVGKSHGGVSTPHTKVSSLNPLAPNQPSYNTKNSPVNPSTQQDIRTVRRYLERKQ
jgi:RHS repeat-associated protein